MIHKVVSVRDAKAEVFNPPFYTKTIGEAERNFMELARDEKSFVSKYPEDYDLYHLGEYDDVTGKLEAFDTPRHITKAVNVLRSVQ